MGSIILVALIVIVILWFVSSQRSLVHYDELCSNSLSQIGVQQESRWDALTALAELTKGYSEHEYKSLMDVIGKRQSITRDSSPQEVDAQETMISSAMKQFMAVAEAYPDLKANQVYQETMQSVNTYENNVRHSRMVYNDSVTKYNRYVRQIPSNIVASLLKFNIREYLQEDKAKSTMPSMKMS